MSFLPSLYSYISVLSSIFVSTNTTLSGQLLQRPFFHLCLKHYGLSSMCETVRLVHFQSLEDWQTFYLIIGVIHLAGVALL